MIDPLVSLSFSVYSNRGAYALLLGSGVSRSAGIPTGWEIVLDLIQKLARIKGTACEPTPKQWYATTFGAEPGYSDLLDSVAKSPTERSQLLRPYFEPTKDEREAGTKIPTPAHRAIAELMGRGFIRVVITTNFDRLLETALADIGLQPTVVSTPDAIAGMLPLAHATCLVVKVNGDYLDSRIKNTRLELGHYDERVVGLVDRILDEFGLIVCGWSGDWDTALRSCIERCPSRRFTTYWTARGDLSTRVMDLVNLRRAHVVQIEDADSFFQQFTDKVIALENIDSAHPLSAKIAVAQAKRYLSTDAGRIDLHDLISRETERACSMIAAHHFDRNTELKTEAIITRIAHYEADVQILLPLMACGGYWGKSQQRTIWAGCLERIANCDSKPSSSFVAWSNLRLLPATLLLYAAGIASVAAGSYENLRVLVEVRVRDWRVNDPLIAPLALNSGAALHSDLTRRLPNPSPSRASQYLFEKLRAPLHDYLPDDRTYTQQFDWFEYLLTLLCWDAKPGWAPFGLFVWRSRDALLGIPKEDESLPSHVEWALRAGFFNGDAARCQAVRQGCNEWLRALPLLN